MTKYNPSWAVRDRSIRYLDLQQFILRQLYKRSTKDTKD